MEIVTKGKFVTHNNFLVLLRISSIQKQKSFSLLIFEAKNGIRQEK